MNKYQIEVFYQDKVDYITGAIDHELTTNYLFVSTPDQVHVINLSKVIKVVIYHKES